MYITESISDVSLYMKEKYRAEMPLFKQLFKTLITRCELIKRFIARPEVCLERKWSMTLTENPQLIHGHLN